MISKMSFGLISTYSILECLIVIFELRVYPGIKMQK